MDSAQRLRHQKLYRFGALFTFGLFMGIMVGVVYIGMNRQSGVTRMDVSKMQAAEETVEDSQQPQEKRAS